MKKAAQYQKIIQILEDTYKGSKSALVFDSVFQLLIAVILSAQTNDNQVNKITAQLFSAYPDAKSMANLTVEQLEDYIRTCGLYKNKAKNIMQTVWILNQKYNGYVPKDLESLLSLPGVGRKTANVIQAVGYGIPALAVDTHVFRVARRLHLASGKTPEAVEKQLCAIIPKEKWSNAHHWLIWHGRKICNAKKPLCEECPLQELCPSRQKQ
ncbi:MAG: endonuclease III [Bacillota bacterium]